MAENVPAWIVRLALSATASTSNLWSCGGLEELGGNGHARGIDQSLVPGQQRDDGTGPTGRCGYGCGS